MAARIIDGRSIAKRIEETLLQDVREFTRSRGRPPRLAAVLVGDDEASQVYVRRKSEAAKRVGIDAVTHRLPARSREADVARLLEQLAADDGVDGILLQIPLPGGLDADRLMGAIPVEKDVDCFHPHNVGRAAQGGAALLPCTPQGVLEILDHERVTLEGAEVCIVNHSNLVGRPLALLLLQRNATVTVCHKYTKGLADHTRRADVLISATGVAGLIGREHVKPGAVVLDVGISRGDGGLAGDVRFEEVKEVAGAITPVPGGVGPLTVAMLLRNILAAARARPRAAARVGGPA